MHSFIIDVCIFITLSIQGTSHNLIILIGHDHILFLVHCISCKLICEIQKSICYNGGVDHIVLSSYFLSCSTELAMKAARAALSGGITVVSYLTCSKLMLEMLLSLVLHFCALTKMNC